MNGQKVLIKKDLFRLHLPHFAAKEFLIDEPSAIVVEIDFLANELPVFLEIADEVLEVFPPEGDIRRLRVFFDQIKHSDPQIAVVNKVASE